MPIWRMMLVRFCADRKYSGCRMVKHGAHREDDEHDPVVAEQTGAPAGSAFLRDGDIRVLGRVRHVS